MSAPELDPLSAALVSAVSGARDAVEEWREANQLLTRAEVCALLGVGKTTLYKLEIPRVMVGDHARWAAPDIAEYVERNRVKV